MQIAPFRAAREAFLTWQWVPGIEKAVLLHQVAAGMRSKQQDLATIMTREGGKPFCENCDEVEWTAACFNYYAEIGRNSRGTSRPPVFEHQVKGAVSTGTNHLGLSMPHGPEIGD